MELLRERNRTQNEFGVINHHTTLLISPSKKKNEKSCCGIGITDVD